MQNVNGIAVPKKKNYFKDVKQSMFILCILVAFIILFYCVASIFTSVGYDTFLQAKEAENRIKEVVGNNYQPLTIIVDPGHGGEDPGAVANGLLEKDLNLQVALKLYDLLSLSGYNVVITRKTDTALYGEGEEYSKKFYDVRNRLKLIESYDNCVYIGIHMNKFPMEEVHGLQTFFSENNPLSQKFALCVQNKTKLLMPDNKREIKPESNMIFILHRSQVPAVLVECGFLSNPADAANLSNSDFQDKLAFTIFCGVTEFLSTKEQ